MKKRPDIHRAIAIVLVAAVLCACATGSIRPFENGQSLAPETEGEKRLWHAARKIETTLIKSGQIHDDPQLCGYLQGIMDRLYPEFRGKLKLSILKAPVLNAFVLPNGRVYVNTGLIAAMENEAQLATVLAHEGIHFINKHSALQRRNYRNSAGVRLTVALLGIPFLPEILTASSIFGYSQQLEMEADNLGHQRLRDAGYDVRQSPKTFRHLVVEAKANKVPESFFWSTHPRLEERIENFEALNAAVIHHSGHTKERVYQDKVADLRLSVLREKITAGKYEAVIAVLTQATLRPMFGDLGGFYLAEAYRLRNGSGDLDNAIKAYESAAALCPDFSPVHKGLGMAYLKSKQFKKAVRCFERFLDIDPTGKESAFVRQYLKQAKSGAER